MRIVSGIDKTIAHTLMTVDKLLRITKLLLLLLLLQLQIEVRVVGQIRYGAVVCGVRTPCARAVAITYVAHVDKVTVELQKLLTIVVDIVWSEFRIRRCRVEQQIESGLTLVGRFACKKVVRAADARR